MKRVLRLLLQSLLIVIVLFFAPLGCMVVAHYSGDTDVSWSSLRRDSSRQALEVNSDVAVIQVYAARAARWRGAFGVHTWIATKRSTDRYYQRMEVIGFGVYRGYEAVRIGRGNPDGYWFGNRPTLLREISGGAAVDGLIERLVTAARDYPYNRVYRVWPGPNSNTFVAHLARRVPELRLELPSTAIGKDYLPGGRLVLGTPSGTGGQLSLGGYLGVLAAVEEGLEVNLLGLTVGIDLLPPAIKLPGIGRLGFPDRTRRNLEVLPPVHPG